MLGESTSFRPSFGQGLVGREQAAIRRRGLVGFSAHPPARGRPVPWRPPPNPPEARELGVLVPGVASRPSWVAQTRGDREKGSRGQVIGWCRR